MSPKTLMQLTHEIAKVTKEKKMFCIFFRPDELMFICTLNAAPVKTNWFVGVVGNKLSTIVIAAPERVNNFQGEPTSTFQERHFLFGITVCLISSFSGLFLLGLIFNNQSVLASFNLNKSKFFCLFF